MEKEVNEKKYALILAGFVVGRYSDCGTPEDLETVRKELQAIGVPSKRGESYEDLIKILTDYIGEKDSKSESSSVKTDDDAYARAMKCVI